jgi:hypothetical protein
MNRGRARLGALVEILCLWKEKIALIAYFDGGFGVYDRKASALEGHIF